MIHLGEIGKSSQPSDVHTYPNTNPPNSQPIRPTINDNYRDLFDDGSTNPQATPLAAIPSAPIMSPSHDKHEEDDKLPPNNFLCPITFEVMEGKFLILLF